MPGLWRARMRYIALAAGTIVVGLAVHLYGHALAPAVRDIVADALWATMAAWWVAAIAPAMRLSSRAAIALVFCFVVELSQLVRVPALDALRATTVGHLLLGSDFDPRDLLAYALGVLAAVILERSLNRRRF